VSCLIGLTNFNYGGAGPIGDYNVPTPFSAKLQMRLQGPTTPQGFNTPVLLSLPTGNNTPGAITQNEPIWIPATATWKPSQAATGFYFFAYSIASDPSITFYASIGSVAITQLD
jgi:hypothetical protein